MKDISSLKLYATQEHPCSYLDNKAATTVFVDPEAQMDSTIYSELSDFGFRRSGKHIYRPHCRSCQACIPSRVPVTSFKPTRSQKRCLKRNKDIEVSVVQTISNEEHYKLYERYIRERHADGDMFPPSRKQYAEFLSSEWGITRFLEFRLGSELIGVAVCDRLDNGISAIYTFFDPDYAPRSIGTFAVLQQLILAKEWNLPFVYLGYWIKECEKMSYKNQYKPLETYVNQQWRPSGETETTGN